MSRPHRGQRIEYIPYGQGIGTVVRVEGKGDAWTRVLVSYASGCMPMPPDGDFDSSPETWKLPMDEVWFSRHEWEELRGGQNEDLVNP